MDDDQRQGIGTALAEKAKDLSPDKLRAYVFQKNHAARSFFEKQGFVEVRMVRAHILRTNLMSKCCGYEAELYDGLNKLPLFYGRSKSPY